MALVDDVTAAIAGAMKARDPDRLSALRLLKSALVNRGVERGRDLTDEEGLQVIASLVKQRREAIDQFEKAGRIDLVEKEAGELAFLESYLPPAPDQAAIDGIIDAVIGETGASSPRDIGLVMKGVMARLQGRGADGRAVNEAVRRRLGA